MYRVRTLFVVNPVSNNGRTLRNWQKIVIALNARGYDIEYILTSGPLDATDITRKALQESYEMVVAVGGDGTINEVANGFYYHDELINPAASLSAIPMGTGGDLTRVFPFPRTVDGIVRLLVKPEIQVCDLGKAIYINWDGEECSRYFINTADIGLGADVCIRVNRNSKAMGGFISFLKAAIGAIAAFKNYTLSVIVDGKNIYKGESSLVAVGNGKYFGGGMMIAPHAKLNDEWFDVVILQDFRRTELLCNIPLVYKGNHLNHPKIIILRGREVEIRSEVAACVELDGETPGLADATFSLVPGGIRIAK